jgi:hypothetical protein
MFVRDVGFCLVLVHLLIVHPCRSDEPSVSSIRAAAERAIRTVESSTREYPDHRDCFSCHHQAVPLFALALARDRGLDVSGNNIRTQLDLTRDDLKGAIVDYRAGKGQPGGVIRAGYALLALEVGRCSGDSTTAAVVEYLLKNDRDKDHWKAYSHRPPSEASEYTASFLALRGLRAFGGAAESQAVADRVARVRTWLEKSEPAETEDRVFRLWALKTASACDETVRAAAARLRAAQQADGGWSQLDHSDCASDAYATGSVLVALHLAAGLPTDETAYRRGLAYLIGSQEKDGSWHVHSRSKPFQPYFESGFPHGRDQFISMAASSWAASALLLALPGTR